MTRLTDTIALLYRMHDDDTAKFADVLLESCKQAWVTTMRSMARKHKCDAAPNPPRLQDLAEYQRTSQEDAASITATYNVDVIKEIERLYRVNPRGNRNYYFANLERWAATRSTWKAPQIAVTTEATAREYAMRRFEEMNYASELKYKFAGPPPTCEDCVKRFAAGIVKAAYIKRYPCPRHPNCPHRWDVVKRPKLTCDQIWVG